MVQVPALPAAWVSASAVPLSGAGVAVAITMLRSAPATMDMACYVAGTSAGTSEGSALFGAAGAWRSLTAMPNKISSRAMPPRM